MNIGDKVKSKGKLSPAVTGVVKAIFDGDFYCKSYSPIYDFTIWHKTFPDWVSKNVYIVEKDIPEVPFYEKDFPEFAADKEYMSRQKQNRVAVYVEYELEAFDWIADLERKIL